MCAGLKSFRETCDRATQITGLAGDSISHRVSTRLEEVGLNSTIRTVEIQRRQLRPRRTRIALQFATKPSISIFSIWLRIEALRNSAMIADASSGSRVARSARAPSSPPGEYRQDAASASKFRGSISRSPV